MPRAAQTDLHTRARHSALGSVVLALALALSACNKSSDASESPAAEDSSEIATVLPGLQPDGNDAGSFARPIAPIEVVEPDPTTTRTDSVTFSSVSTDTATSISTSDQTSTSTESSTATSTSSDAQLSLSESTLAIDANASTVAAGQVINLTLTLRDQYQHVFALNNATINFTTSGGTSTGTFGPVQNTENGVYRATFTAALAGTPITIAANVDNAPLTSALPSLQVVPGSVSAAHAQLSVGNSSLVQGQSTTVTLQLRDALGNIVPDPAATVTFDLDGGGSDGTFGSAVHQGNGLYAATLTATTAGSASQVRAWIDGDLVTSALPTITVVPANSTFTLTYDGNKHDAGTTPSASTHTVGTTVTVAANSGTLRRSAYIFAGWNTAADGSGTTYAAGTGTFSMGASNMTLYAKWNIDCSQLAGGTWIGVSGNHIYGTSDFCVQKYLPSKLTTSGNDVATAQAGLTPWVGISQDTARTRCMALGNGYHLMSNPEWMTIAANIANQTQNWSNNVIGSGTLVRGHSDENPNSACAADADDNKAWVEGNCSGQTLGAQQFHQRRTHYLSNGNVIWDIGGNLLQWVDYNNPYDKPNPQSAWLEFSALGNGSTTSPREHFVPRSSVQSWWNDSWNSSQAIGMIYPGPNGSGGALLRGNFWGAQSSAGLFAAHMANSSAQTTGAVGFRCAYMPPAPSLYNNTAAMSAGAATTASGKSLTLTNGVWVESGSGTRVLAADGSDQWAMRLNPDGRSYSNQLLDKANVAGRVCPSNVFVPGNLVATERCLYYDAGNTAQRLDAPANDGVTVQNTLNAIRLGNWNSSGSGNGSGPSWYEGNLQTCAAKGMRLPTLYETTASDPGISKPIDASVNFATLSTGVPSVGSSLTWTASASTNQSQRYWSWSMNNTPSISHFNEGNAVRCVVP